MKKLLFIVFMLLASILFINQASAFTLLDFKDPYYGNVPPYHYDGPNPLRWQSGSTVDYAMHSSISSVQTSIITEAFSAWYNTGINLNFNLLSGIVTTYDNPNPVFNQWSGQLISPPSWANGTTFYRVSQPQEFSFGAIGLTSVHDSLVDGTILAAPIYLASQAFSYSNDSNLFYNVTLHEIGHLLGLGHVANDPNAIMYPYANSSGRSLLSSDDIAGVHYLYGTRNINPVPEPMTMLLFGPALLCLLGYKRKGV